MYLSLLTRQLKFDYNKEMELKGLTLVLNLHF